MLTQRAVQNKENEISAAAALFHPALVKGRINSSDAMHTQKKWCACVHLYGGFYLFSRRAWRPLRFAMPYASDF